MNAFLFSEEDVQWLNETHLKGVVLPTKYKNFKSAILQGNEDCPYALNLYVSQSPTLEEDYLRVTFDHETPIYCEYEEYDGVTNKKKH